MCGRVRLYCCLQIHLYQLDIVHYPSELTDVPVQEEAVKLSESESCPGGPIPRLQETHACHLESYVPHSSFVMVSDCELL